MSAPSHRGPDFVQRQNRRDAVLALFRSHPGQWMTVRELAYVGGFAAWRSRVSEVRQVLVKAHEGTIEWNRLETESAYRFVPSQESNQQRPGVRIEDRLF